MPFPRLYPSILLLTCTASDDKLGGAWDEATLVGPGNKATLGVTWDEATLGGVWERGYTGWGLERGHTGWCLRQLIRMRGRTQFTIIATCANEGGTWWSFHG